MINAQTEFVDLFKLHNDLSVFNVKCAVVGYNPSSMIDLRMEDIVSGKGCVRRAVLPTGWKNDQWLQFLQDLNFNYHSGYGCQELYGVVWLENGSWFERDEYDGLERWVLTSSPQIPREIGG